MAKFISKLSYSLNFGTYGISEIGHSLGHVRFTPHYGVFKEAKQFSSYLEGSKKLQNGLNCGFIATFDKGELYYHCVDCLRNYFPAHYFVNGLYFLINRFGISGFISILGNRISISLDEKNSRGVAELL